MKRVDAILFSCGSEADWWLYCNCQNCWKGNLMRSDGWAKSACGICNDIFIQMIAGAEHMPTERAAEAVKHDKCPYFATTRPKKELHKHRPIPGQLVINFDV